MKKMLLGRVGLCVDGPLLKLYNFNFNYLIRTNPITHIPMVHEDGTQAGRALLIEILGYMCDYVLRMHKRMGTNTMAAVFNVDYFPIRVHSPDEPLLLLLLFYCLYCTRGES